ELSVA
ncbi:bacterial regulatory helix-turn-helix, lysR family protein, partial [Vibrio parahaemolyticus V-223/04]